MGPKWESDMLRSSGFSNLNGSNIIYVHNVISIYVILELKVRRGGEAPALAFSIEIKKKLELLVGLEIMTEELIQKLWAYGY